MGFILYQIFNGTFDMSERFMALSRKWIQFTALFMTVLDKKGVSPPPAGKLPVLNASARCCIVLLALGLGVGLGFSRQGVSQSVSQSPLENLPPVLQDWVAPIAVTDYWDQIRPTASGYLRWREFPVRVAIEPLSPEALSPQRDRQWFESMQNAIEDWQAFFPLREVTALEANPQDWDIYIQRSRPPAQRLADGTILPARLADTRYHFSPVSSDSAGKWHVWIRVGTQQGAIGLESTARHELGHALGLWGHSPHAEDVMYAAQIGLYPAISDRDVQTLRLLYGQR